MIDETVKNLFAKSPSLSLFREKLLSQNSLLIEGLWDSPKALLIFLAMEALQKNILVLTGGVREDLLFENLSYFFPEKILEFPAWETLPGEESSPSFDVMGKRSEVLHRFSQEKGHFICLSSLQAVLQKTFHKEELSSLFSSWSVGEELPFSLIPDMLSSLGYQKVPSVFDKGTFALRGGIIDLFSATSPYPVRVEFFEDKIESIRTFDASSQKSIGKIEKILIGPANEQKFASSQKVSSLLDFIGDKPLILFDDLLSIEDHYSAYKGNPSSLLFSLEEFFEKIKSSPHLFFSQKPIEELSEVKKLSKEKAFEHISFEWMIKTFQTGRLFTSFLTVEDFFASQEPHEDLFESLALEKNLPSLLFLNEKESQEKEVQKKIEEKGVSLPEALWKQGFLSSGFALADIPLVVLPYSEIFDYTKIRRQKWRVPLFSSSFIQEFHPLSPGELVVHFHSGIGKYLGIEKLPNHVGKEEEFLAIEYAEKGKLYVPLSQSHLVSRYIGSHEEAPTLSTLGTKRWSQTKQKAQQQIVGYASELLNLYAERELKGGFAFAPDSQVLLDFEEEFPYEETPDQLAAIEAVKKDMIASKAMDRLICGDVGYGKTEVAMRAAFKAVIDGKKQVAILVPTTILALQHFDTFQERMRNHPVRIAALSRFHTQKENRLTLEKAKKGEIDILIGTHRLLSEDVQFKDLGLLIIDEEQRFGVRAKEALKKRKKEVDCLTLSATPIPRTLYLSLVQARDLSVIYTPPQDRLPIKTIIAANEDPLLQNAIFRELAREGQVFFLHNRIESLYQRAEHIQKLVPRARSAIVHGQMDPEDIDKIFHDFQKGNADILFATTLIENGIDIPNANTIFIDRADTFGLADLYQLRGRVGRWNRMAYAYFLLPPKATLSEIAKKRLSAIAEASGFGGGIKIAMRDLEIRGAGDILGTQQSGQVSAIGFFLYCKLLRRAMVSLKNKQKITFVETKMEYPYDARLSENYLSERELRMEIYQRLGEASSSEEINELFQELNDRFGTPPKETLFLFSLARIRAFASRHRFIFLKFAPFSLTAHLQIEAKVLEKTILFPKKISSPEELEAITLDLLQRNFSL